MKFYPDGDSTSPSLCYRRAQGVYAVIWDLRGLWETLGRWKAPCIFCKSLSKWEMTSFKQLTLKSLHPLIHSSQPRPTLFFFHSDGWKGTRPQEQFKGNSRRAGMGLGPIVFSENVSVSARLTHGDLEEIMELTRWPQRDFIHLILEMLARRHRNNARLFGPSGEINFVTNPTDRAVQVPKTSVITFGAHQGIYVCY